MQDIEIEKRIRFENEQEFGDTTGSIDIDSLNQKNRRVIVAARASSFVELVESSKETKLFTKPKLIKFLNHFGSFPDKHRPLIWKFILKLPENRASYDALLSKGIHPSMKYFRKQFPLKSDRLARSMERILSALAYWSPIFENLEYLPSMVFPFVKLLVGDTFTCFEVVMTVLLNWCEKWWDYYPNPPIEVLDIIENLLSYHDSELVEHLKSLGITSQIYAWSMLQNFFSDIFSKDSWAAVWDHLLINEPSFIVNFVVAYQIYFRKVLLNSKKVEDIKSFYMHSNALQLEEIFQIATKLNSTTPPKLHPATFYQPFQPIISGNYPIFNKFPVYIVDYQNKVRERIRRDEEEYIKKRKSTHHVNKLAQELQRDKKAWEAADWKMNDLVAKWWDKIVDVEREHEDKKAELDASEIEERSKALNDIAEARKSFINHHISKTNDHMSTISKAHTINTRSRNVLLQQAQLEEQYQKIEDEWLARRSEMLRAREEIQQLDKARMERFVRDNKSIGKASVSKSGSPSAKYKGLSEPMKRAVEGGLQPSNFAFPRMRTPSPVPRMEAKVEAVLPGKKSGVKNNVKSFETESFSVPDKEPSKIDAEYSINLSSIEGNVSGEGLADFEISSSILVSNDGPPQNNVESLEDQSGEKADLNPLVEGVPVSEVRSESSFNEPKHNLNFQKNDSDENRRSEKLSNSRVTSSHGLTSTSVSPMPRKTRTQALRENISRRKVQSMSSSRPIESRLQQQKANADANPSQHDSVWKNFFNSIGMDE
ncbi:TBC1 domain member 31 [Nowakowskiella sp. JEL0407]|nr:TBC1 domain member 31 [Nowakowskiella sp. JEL0407]